MKLSIRSKLIFAISLLIVILFSIASYLFITEKKREIAQDIYVNVLAFSKLTAPTVAYDYELYLKENSFVYFNREIQAIFEQNDDINVIKVISYEGELLYDSSIDKDKKYEGSIREVDDKLLLDQVRSENLSLRTLDGRIFYLKTNPKGGFAYVDKDEKPITSLEEGPLVNYLIVPADEKKSILYLLDYENLNQRIERMQKRIIYLALFGIMLGMILSYFMSHQVTKPVAQLVEAAGNIAKGDFKTRVDIRTHDELNFLGNAFNKMAEDLEVSVEARMYKERVTRELELAIQIQQQLVPKIIPKVDGLDLAAGLLPAEEIGGDIYDFLMLNENQMLLYLGDVTGHGVPAGIVSSIASALFFGYASQGDLKKILIEVNRVLKYKTMPTMFMTLCLMHWDALAKQFTYASAGHEQIVHYRASGNLVELKPAGGVALGMLPDISKTLKVVPIDLKSGDHLVIYSDGIPECWKDEKENYGMERLKQASIKFANLATAEEIKNAILADVKSYAGSYKQMDDITIIVVKKL
ncbi:SpoIIE family protein phosphatase [Candidatus Peregrinibacteria bacterium]|nr:SpoIIE family protein phosphatase [Candidatus Peregrinibacteria bacterium]